MRASTAFEVSVLWSKLRLTKLETTAGTHVENKIDIWKDLILNQAKPLGPRSLVFSRAAARSLSSNSLRKSRVRNSSGGSWVGCLNRRIKQNDKNLILQHLINLCKREGKGIVYFTGDIEIINNPNPNLLSVVCWPVFDFGVAREISAGILFG